jgi:hypothetical protein
MAESISQSFPLWRLRNEHWNDSPSCLHIPDGKQIHSVVEARETGQGSRPHCTVAPVELRPAERSKDISFFNFAVQTYEWGRYAQGFGSTSQQFIHCTAAPCVYLSPFTLENPDWTMNHTNQMDLVRASKDRSEPRLFRSRHRIGSPARLTGTRP